MMKQFVPPDETPGAQVRALQRGLDMLFQLIDSAVPLGVSELARRTQLPKPTVSRLLATLVAGGYATCDTDTGLYSVGPEVAWRFLVARLDPFLRALISQAMESLRAQSGETVGLYVPVSPDRVCIEQKESPSGLRRVHEIGRRWPLTLGSSGYAYLAFVDEQEVMRTLELRPLRPFTPLTLVDRGGFLARLEQVRRDGFAITVSQSNMGMCGLSAPIFGPAGRPIAMLVVSGPESRWSEAVMRAFVPTLLTVTSQLSQVAGSTGADVQASEVKA